jgi:hypothetical protein
MLDPNILSVPRITQVSPGHQCDEGIDGPAVRTSRDVGERPQLIEYQYTTIRRLELVPFKYLANGKETLNFYAGSRWGFVGQQKDSIDFYMCRILSSGTNYKILRFLLKNVAPVSTPGSQLTMGLPLCLPFPRRPRARR